MVARIFNILQILYLFTANAGGLQHSKLPNTIYYSTAYCASQLQRIVANSSILVWLGYHNFILLKLVL